MENNSVGRLSLLSALLLSAIGVFLSSFMLNAVGNFLDREVVATSLWEPLAFRLTVGFVLAACPVMVWVLLHLFYRGRYTPGVALKFLIGLVILLGIVFAGVGLRLVYLKNALENVDPSFRVSISALELPLWSGLPALLIFAVLLGVVTLFAPPEDASDPR